MKKIYLFLMMLIPYGISVAQPTLTAANSNPVIGQMFEKNFLSGH